MRFWRAKDCEREQNTIDMKEVNRKRVADCPGCLTKCSEVFALSCGHTFCRDCIRGLFLTALKDKSYMPVRCCGKRVDQRLRREVLTIPELEKFEADLEDIELPRKMYCPKKGCGKLYNLDLMASSFKCDQCKSQLCAYCKASHPSITCSQYRALPLSDKSLEDVQFFDEARRQQYSRCNKCGRFVSKISGCDSIYCPCGHTFNYHSHRYTGPTAGAGALRDYIAPRPVLPPAASGKCAYEIEQEPCEHDWVDLNHSLEQRACHLCRRHRLCYQSVCTKCRVRTCAGCRVKKSGVCVIL